MKTSVPLASNVFVSLLKRIHSSHHRAEPVIIHQLLNDCLDREEHVDLNVIVGVFYRVYTPLEMVLGFEGLRHIMSQSSSFAIVQDPAQKAWPLNEKQTESFEYLNCIKSGDELYFMQLDYLAVRMLWRGADPWLKAKENCAMDYLFARDMGAVVELHLQMQPEKEKEFTKKLSSSPLFSSDTLDLEYPTWWHYWASQGLKEIAVREFQKGFDFSEFPLDKAHPLVSANYSFLSTCLDYGLVPNDKKFISKIEESIKSSNIKGQMTREQLLEISERLSELKGESFDVEKSRRKNYLHELQKIGSESKFKNFKHESYSWDELIETYEYGKKKEKTSILGKSLEVFFKYKPNGLDFPFSKIWSDFKSDGSLLVKIDELKDKDIKGNCLKIICRCMVDADGKGNLNLGVSDSKALTEIILKNFNMIEHLFNWGFDKNVYVSTLNTPMVWKGLNSTQRQKAFGLFLRTDNRCKEKLDVNSCPPDLEKGSIEHQIWQLKIELMKLNNSEKAYGARSEARELSKNIAETIKKVDNLLDKMTIKDIELMKNFNKDLKSIISKSSVLSPLIHTHQKVVDLMESLKLNETLIPANNGALPGFSNNRF